MAAEQGVAIGVDLGGTTFAVSTLTCGGKANHRDVPSFPTPVTTDPEDVVDAIVKRVKETREKIAGDIAGVGIGVPGVVEPDTGRVVRCPNLQALNNTLLGSMLSDRLGVPAYVGNDAFCATLAELRWGAGRGCENMVLLTLGTGIGGGVAIGNKVLRGPRQVLGEIGHLVVWPDGPRCGCGNHGCLEAIAGRDGIVDRTLKRLQDGRESTLAAVIGDELRDVWADLPRLVAQEAAKGDEVAREVMAETGMWIGVGICSALVLCDPDLVVLGGGIAAAGDLLFDPIRRTVEARSRITRGKFDVANIVPAQLGASAGVRGAAGLVWERLAEG